MAAVVGVCNYTLLAICMYVRFRSALEKATSKDMFLVWGVG